MNIATLNYTGKFSVHALADACPNDKTASMVLPRIVAAKGTLTLTAFAAFVARLPIRRLIREKIMKLYRMLAGAYGTAAAGSTAGRVLARWATAENIRVLIRIFVFLERSKVRTVYSGPVLLPPPQGNRQADSKALYALMRGKEVVFTAGNAAIITPFDGAFLAACCTIGNMPLSLVMDRSVCGTSGTGKNRSVVCLAIGRRCSTLKQERIIMLETNIDDLHPHAFDTLQKKLFHAGALDVFVRPIFMKKQRPAYMLCVLLCHTDRETISRCLFQESPTFGIRFFELERYTLSRRTTTIRLREGAVRIKVGMLDGDAVIVSPEYDDMCAIMKKAGKTYRELYGDVRRKVARLPSPLT